MLGGLTSDYFMGLSFANVFRPDLVPGQTLWVTDHSAPGGRWLNPSAFRPAADFVQGNLGRNVITGFGMYQIDLVLQAVAPIPNRSVQCAEPPQLCGSHAVSVEPALRRACLYAEHDDGYWQPRQRIDADVPGRWREIGSGDVAVSILNRAQVSFGCSRTDL